MNYSKQLSIILFILLAKSLLAQHQNVIIDNTSSWAVPTEPSVVINPNNPDEIMVGAMSDYYYISTNGGQLWTPGSLQSTWGVQADPCVLADNSGRFYYVHLPDVIERAVCHRRDNILSDWTMESDIAYDGTHDVDKEWACYDPVTDRIYLSWTYFDEWGSSNPNDSSCIFLSWSEDNGVSWNDPKRISDQKGDAQGGTYSAHGSYATTGPNGEIYICWWGPEGLMFDRSTDQGINWMSEDINITNENINWIYNIPGIQLGVSFPIIACDRSGGENNGTIYICWADPRNGWNDTDVFLVKSSDGGLNWSDPMRINDDAPDSHQFFPFMSVDQATGKVWVVFYDRRDYTDENTDVFMAMSEDGGETFTNFKVSETPFIPYSTVFFGHYIALATVDDKIIPVWNRMDDGVSTLMCAIVNPGMVGTEEISWQPVAELVSRPNPFQESLFISYKICQPEDVSILLYDITGQLICTVVNSKHHMPGKYVEKIHAGELNLHPGAYLVKLITKNDYISSKAIFVK